MATMDAPHNAALPTSGQTSAPSLGRLLRDYFILTKPSIILLLLITTVPAMVLADEGWPGWGPVLATLFGGDATGHVQPDDGRDEAELLALLRATATSRRDLGAPVPPSLLAWLDS